MSALLAYTQVDHGYDKDYYEQHKCCRARKTVVTGDGKVVLNMSYYGVHIRTARNGFILTEDTDDAGVFLESADKAGDDSVREHGRKQRNGDSGKNAPLGSAVDLCSVVVLFVDTLQTAKKNKYLEGQSIPYDVDDKCCEACPGLCAVVDPVDPLHSE